MDKQVVDNIKKVYLGILIYDILGILILFVIKKASFSTIVGLILGSVVSMIAFYMLAISIISMVEKDKKRAILASTFGYSARFLLYGAVLVFAALNDSVNIYTVAFGIISTSLVIRVQNLGPKLFKGKGE